MQDASEGILIEIRGLARRGYDNIMTVNFDIVTPLRRDVGLLANSSRVCRSTRKLHVIQVLSD